MKISIITDEISADPETAIELGSHWGIHDFELRGFFSERVPLISPFQKQCLHDAVDEFGARIIAVGPGIFKEPFPLSPPPRTHLSWMDQANYEEWASIKERLQYHLNELLPPSLDFAAEFGAGLVVIFGFNRLDAVPGLPPDEALEYLHHAAEKASAARIQLALENEAGFWADTGQRTAEIVRAVGHPSLGVNWDPGNAFFAADEPFPVGYQFVRGLVRHVHFKDAQRTLAGNFEYCAVGQVDWAGQLRALADDGFDGFISIETHLHPKVAAAEAALERLKALLAEVELEKKEVKTNESS